MKRPAAVGFSIGAVAGVAAAAVARRRAATTAGPVVSATSVGRNVRLARLGARAGARHTVASAQSVFASAARREAIDRSVELRHAEDIARELGAMKGALMKLGQMVSYLDEGLPEHVRTVLSQLQQDAPPMSVELAARVIEEQLGAPPDAVFARFDPDPIAAASIGQVHRALTHDGRAVAVKIQYPGIAEAVESDLGNVGLLFGGIGRAYPGFEAGPLVDELRDRLREELDYELEAQRQQQFADYYAAHPFIHVPSVIPQLSTASVLTSELAEGVRFSEAETWPAEQRDLAGEAIFRFVFRSFYRLHLFNGDPHPGNYLFRPDGRVTFLDFGLVKAFAPPDIALIRRLIETIVLDPDPVEFRLAMERAGFLQPDAPVSNEAVTEYFGHFYAHMRERGRHTITGEFASETVRRFFDVNGPYGDVMRHANVPPAFVVVQRVNLGLFAVLAQLGATADWRSVGEELWPWVNGPPSSALGELEAEWIAVHHPELGH
ncbi:MAG: AarF/ABC1/UbiB kinase family protein [Acidimicrobiia bacterium]|nr:AarF/ABC1/UbiB kinase family protein [Acidimicrobiia bacterium]